MHVNMNVKYKYSTVHVHLVGKLKIKFVYESARNGQLHDVDSVFRI